MDRLTKPDFTICTTCRAHDRCEIERHANGTPKCRDAKIYERLAAYEDTGLTPEEIQRIKLASTVDALCDMVNQFAFESSPYRGKTTLYHGGLSALESAFAALEAMGARFTADGRLPRKELFRIWHETGKEDRK